MEFKDHPFVWLTGRRTVQVLPSDPFGRFQVTFCRVVRSESAWRQIHDRFMWHHETHIVRHRNIGSFLYYKGKGFAKVRWEWWSIVLDVCHSELNSGLVNDGIEFGRFGLRGLFVSLTFPFKIWVFQFPSRLVWNQNQTCLGFLSLREIVAASGLEGLQAERRGDKLTIRPLSSPSARGFQHHPKHSHFSRGGWVMFWCHFWFFVPVMGVQMVVKNSKNEWFIMPGFHPFAVSVQVGGKCWNFVTETPWISFRRCWGD